MTKTAGQALECLHNLDECILLDMQLLHYQTVVSLVFNYVWDDQEEFRANLDEILPVELRIHLVEHIQIRNGLNEAMLREPERMNWGMNEIAVADIAPAAPLAAPKAGDDLVMHGASFLWNDDRRIDIDFIWLEIRSPGDRSIVVPRTSIPDS